jgi:hypothetical protein
MSDKGDWVRLVVKYKGKCTQCGKDIPQGEYALWSRSSKAIRHLKCETIDEPADKKHEQVLELDCFVCGRPAGCAECSFEGDCNRALVSQACICSLCLSDSASYDNYQQAFLGKMRKAGKGLVI